MFINVDRKTKEGNGPAAMGLRRTAALVLTGAMMLSMTGCKGDMITYDDYTPEAYAESSLTQVGSTLSTESYVGEEAVVEEALEVYKSEDGRCIIEKKPSYYEIYLDNTDGDYYASGSAYAETIKKIDLEYAELLEPYLYENIKMAFPNLNGDYSPVSERIDKLLINVPEEYRDEMEGFATTMSDGKKGFKEDGILSYEEAILMQMVPDCLRGTNCNALSVWGDKTVSGDRIVSRTLEWTLGSENQMCLGQAVCHFKMPEGKNSYTTFAVMGMLDVITGVNETGVFAGILDVGSGDDYVCDGKKCYTYELRYALENMDDARSVGEYMVSESKNFTFSHNIIITDKDNSFVAEDCVQDETVASLKVGQENSPEDKIIYGHSVLRDGNTPLMDGLTWDNPDSLCVINSFMTEGNADIFTGEGHNYVRFAKFNAWVGEKDKLTMADVKDIVTRETEDKESRYQKIHSENVYQTIIYDYGTGELDACFTQTEGVVNHPQYIRIKLD